MLWIREYEAGFLRGTLLGDTDRGQVPTGGDELIMKEDLADVSSRDEPFGFRGFNLDAAAESLMSAWVV